MRGFGIAEGVVLAGVVLALVALVVSLAPGCAEEHPAAAPEAEAQQPAEPEAAEQPEKMPEPKPVFDRMKFAGDKIDCLNNVRNLVGLLEVTSPTKYPEHAGPNLLLYLVKKGQLDPERHLGLLFCPGDDRETLALAGGPTAYRNLDLARREYGHLTSYAGRDQLDEATRAKKGDASAKILLCDDSADHHAGRGFVVGLTGGAARWRDRIDDWGLEPDAEVFVGEGSPVEELRCLRAE